jgi:hypothetical protein
VLIAGECMTFPIPDIIFFSLTVHHQVFQCSLSKAIPEIQDICIASKALFSQPSL